jgi:beta-glucosidase
VPCADDYFASPYEMRFREGIYAGYKYYTSQNVEVKYPFGYGLSYTTFEYGNFKITVGGISFTVKNTGDRAGATVAQMYITAPRPNVSVSPAELKGFKKVFLHAGEECEVFIDFDDYSFRKWNCERNVWTVGGTYEVCLADNCNDVLFKACITLGRDNYTLPYGYEFSDDKDGDKLPYKIYFNRNIYAEQLHKNDKNWVIGKNGKRKFIVADYRTEVADLKYCKGFLGRLFGFIASKYNRSKDKLLASSMTYLPVRSLMQFMRFNDIQAQGFLQACNGQFFKGVKKIILKK